MRYLLAKTTHYHKLPIFLFSLVKLILLCRHGNGIPSETKGGGGHCRNFFSTKEGHWDYKRLPF